MLFFFFFFKQKTAYEMRISDWSSDVCSSDLVGDAHRQCGLVAVLVFGELQDQAGHGIDQRRVADGRSISDCARQARSPPRRQDTVPRRADHWLAAARHRCATTTAARRRCRSEEHTSELQSLMRISYAVFCLKKKTQKHIKQ